MEQDGLPRPDAEGAQPGRQRAAGGVQFPVAEGLGADHRGGPLGVAAQGGAQALGYIGGGHGGHRIP